MLDYLSMDVFFHPQMYSIVPWIPGQDFIYASFCQGGKICMIKLVLQCFFVFILHARADAIVVNGAYLCGLFCQLYLFSVASAVLPTTPVA